MAIEQRIERFMEQTEREAREARVALLTHLLKRAERCADLDEYLSYMRRTISAAGERYPHTR